MSNPQQDPDRTVIGSIYKGLAWLTIAIGVLVMLVGALATDKEFATVTGGLLIVGSALGVYWMGAVVDLLHRIACRLDYLKKPSQSLAGEVTPQQAGKDGPKKPTPTTYKID